MMLLLPLNPCLTGISPGTLPFITRQGKQCALQRSPYASDAPKPLSYRDIVRYITILSPPRASSATSKEAHRVWSLYASSLSVKGRRCSSAANLHASFAHATPPHQR